MIRELDEGLRELFASEMSKLGFDAAKVQIDFGQPTSDWVTQPGPNPTLNLFLYDLRENTKLRHTRQGWEMQQRPDGTTMQRRSALLADLHYIITAWAKDPNDEHRLLEGVLLALVRIAHAPEELLPPDMRDPSTSVSIEVAQPDPGRSLTELWNALGNKLRPAVFCTLTVSMNPYEARPVPIVRSRELRFVQPIFSVKEPFPLGESRTELGDAFRQQFAEHGLPLGEARVRGLEGDETRTWYIDAVPANFKGQRTYRVERGDGLLRIYEEPDQFWSIGGILYLRSDTPVDKLRLKLPQRVPGDVGLQPEHVLVFSLPEPREEFRGQLDAGRLPDEVQRQIRKEAAEAASKGRRMGIQFSEHMTICKKERPGVAGQMDDPDVMRTYDGIWQMDDADLKRTYDVVWQKEALAIYRQAARFVIGNLRAGSYTLELSLGGRSLGAAKSFDVPAPDLSFEIDDLARD